MSSPYYVPSYPPDFFKSETTTTTTSDTIRMTRQLIHVTVDPGQNQTAADIQVAQDAIKAKFEAALASDLQTMVVVTGPGVVVDVHEILDYEDEDLEDDGEDDDGEGEDEAEDSDV